MTRMHVKSMGTKEKATFELALSLIKWEPLYRLDSCNEKYVYYQTVIDKLIELCFPSKVVTRHTGDKPWITDGYRLLIQKRQRVHMRGDISEARSLRNQVNRATAKLKFEVYQTCIEAMHESGSKHWWENMNKLMGQKTTDTSNVQSLANKTTDVNVELLASKMNDFFVSVSEHLPRLDRNNEAFDVDGQLPNEYVIDLATTLQALRKVKTNKATGPDNVPAWILKNHASILAGPLTAIFNASLREHTCQLSVIRTESPSFSSRQNLRPRRRKSPSFEHRYFFPLSGHHWAKKAMASRRSGSPCAGNARKKKA